MKRLLLVLCLLLSVTVIRPAMAGGSNAGDGRWVNPISDVCWKCLFPMTLGSIQLASGAHPDTPNPSMPIQLCPYGIFYRLGLAIGFWEPLALTDVTREPGVMVNMGGFKIDLGRTGTGRAGQSDSPTPGSFYHVHWYKYPLLFWLNIITSTGCMQTGDMDIAYLSEVDPLWNDSTLSMIINPEVALFNNLLAQGACAADSISSTAGMPLDPLFWCAGAQGSMYPFTGYTSNEFSPLEASLLVTERMDFKLHREGLVMETVGADVAVCYEYPSPIIPKSRWRYQMVNMYPEPSDCHPFGTSTQLWGSTHNTPATKKNFGWLLWRKRNCVYL
ncbi:MULTISPECIES: conjugal transfer pilus assembly protein TraU [Pantoea]|jgi:conjugal transfer pilus assembly protein TraU|uniref:conjugal transfer pilus assembly protein TraU n=1 Tax=Pantoea TaxID=53335 RepID=UPI00030A48AB|nr:MULTISPECIES: conjugal transfer pilus assembly protein TraU [Pantoea]MDF7788389.1 conjugal transfer pilus assembly protein TraU [Pantoea stewartii]MDI3416043.1 conjugal transfer pilus assembly protein TraU [Pantoea sp. V106_11]SFY15286.1 conjugal transfer pilus assembly protein TraU [Pantoea ananatis]